MYNIGSFVALMLGFLMLGAGSTASSPPDLGRCGIGASVAAVLDEFGSHRLVLLGEQHQRKEFHEFLSALVRDPRFAQRVNDIVVEFGNSRFQAVMDRWIDGSEVTPSELRHVWQDTTQLLVWDSPLYEEVFRLIREQNRRLPADQRIRVLLGDPPIDWSKVRDAKSYGRYADRDGVFAEVVEREVVARERSALLVIGGEHVLRTPSADPLPPHAGVGDLLTRRHPGATCVIYTVSPKRPLSGQPDCVPLFLSASGEVGGRSFVELLQPGLKVQRTVNGKKVWIPVEQVQWPRVRERTDALLWLGADELLVSEAPEVLKDRDYILEIYRRAKIMSDFFGFDLTGDLPPIPNSP